MGGCASKSSPLALFGLDNSGKTTLINYFKEKIVLPTPLPTNGNIISEVVDISGQKFIVCDVSGQEKGRRTWKHKLHGTTILLYLIDIQDTDRWDTSLDTLHELIKNDYNGKDSYLKEIPLIICLNKIDTITDQVDLISKVNEFQTRAFQKLEVFRKYLSEAWVVPISILKERNLNSVYTLITHTTDDDWLFSWGSQIPPGITKHAVKLF